MKTNIPLFAKPLIALLALLPAGISTRCQKAYPVEINSILSKVPIPQGSEACYAACTKTTDPSNGVVSIKDTGPAFQSIQYQLDKINKAAVSDAMGAGVTTMAATPPSADQIEQMKQQALARAAQAQTMNAQQMAQMHNNPGAGTAPRDNPDLMRLIGQAQTAAGKLSQLSTELSSKIAALDHSAIDNAPMGPNCPEVMQGGYAGPTCACQIQRAATYETKRVAARNAFLQQVNALLTEYIGKLHTQLAVIDDAEAKAKYGDAVSNPAFKQQVVIIQRQALGAIASVIAIAGGNWEDAAKQYAGLVNAKSGASVGCNHR